MGPDACLADGPFQQKCFLKITDRNQMNLNVPLLYTYKTRMNNYRGLLGYLSLDLVPLLLVVGITSLQDVSNILLLFLLWLTLYEIGYLFNDLKDRHRAGELDRTPGPVSGNWYLPAIPRLVLAAVIVWGVALRMGWTKAVMAVGLNLFVLALLFCHSSDFVRRHFPGRLITFLALALFKYSPALVPVTGAIKGASALLMIFLFYGMARVLNYTLRKFGNENVGLSPRAQTKMQLGILTIFSPLAFFPYASADRAILLQARVLWIYFFAITLLSLMAFFLRRQLAGRS